MFKLAIIRWYLKFQPATGRTHRIQSWAVYCWQATEHERHAVRAYRKKADSYCTRKPKRV